MTFDETISFLAANAGALSDRDRSFALSLLEQHGRYGSLSQKQTYWVEELARRVTEHSSSLRAQATASTARAAGAQSAQSSRGVTFQRIIELINPVACQGEGVSHAKVLIRAADGRQLRLSMAGTNSNSPLSVNVTDTTADFASRVWYGRILQTGAWQPSRKIDGATLRAVEAALAEFDADPARVAAEFGHSTGNCCFCSRELTDERSVSVGYGPVCAARWSLPWGETPGPSKAELKAELISDAEVPF